MTTRIKSPQLLPLPAEHTCLLCSSLRLSKPDRSALVIKQYYPHKTYFDKDGEKHRSLRSAYYPGVFTSPFCQWHDRERARSKEALNGNRA